MQFLKVPPFYFPACCVAYFTPPISQQVCLRSSFLILQEFLPSLRQSCETVRLTAILWLCTGTDGG